MDQRFTRKGCDTSHFTATIELHELYDIKR